jgi:hypothetical protein
MRCELLALRQWVRKSVSVGLCVSACARGWFHFGASGRQMLVRPLVCVRGTGTLMSVATDLEVLGREKRRARVETQGMGSGARIPKREKAMKTGARRV